MSKIVLNDVTNLNALSVINDNFDKLEQELQNKVLYRDNPEGEPNTLENDIDANGNSLYNVQDLTINGGFTVDGQDVGAYIGQAADAATDALASATAAANSATAAGISASSANADANSATASASTATTKASEASTSASNAATSASTATTQAGIATTGANTATTKASEASTSASNAATSETNAASSASSASTSASNASSSEVNAAASAAAAATALDNFDDRYLGAKSTAPTLDNDGNALITGALYYNNGTVVTEDKGMWIYDGSIWIKSSAASQAILITYEFVATAGQTSFSGNDANGVSFEYTVGSILVTLNGTKLRPGDDYTASTGTSLVLSVAASAGDELLIDSFSTFDLANTYTKAEADALLANKLSTANGAVGTNNLADGSVTPVKLSQKLTSGTAVSASGTAVNFTDIPSWVKRVTVMLSNVSTNGSSYLMVQLGSGSVQTTGYTAVTVNLQASNSMTSSTSGFIIYQNVASEAAHGTIVFTLLNSNLWVASGTLGSVLGVVLGYNVAGSVTLSSALDRLRLTTVNGTDTFDAGSINILYE